VAGGVEVGAVAPFTLESILYHLHCVVVSIVENFVIYSVVVEPNILFLLHVSLVIGTPSFSWLLIFN
jgi:hypothetical protein